MNPATAPREAAPPGKRPRNLVLVFADQMRYMAMGCAGNEDVKTPHLDRFAAEGANFTDAVSNAAVCVVHRASLLTGRFPLASTVFANNVQLPPDMPSLGKTFKEAGYATAYIGKWHLAGEPALAGYVPPGPMRHGFDYWAAHNCTHQYWNASYYRDAPEPLTHQGWEPDGQTDLATEFIKSHATGAADANPFALVMSWGPPHTPFIAPPEFEQLYRPETISLRPNVMMRDDWLTFGDNGGYDGRYQEPEMMLRDFIARYYAAVSNLDHNFGRLLQTLDELGIAEDTLVVFTSDHGDMLGSQGHLHKYQPWEESVRVPLLFRCPGTVPAGWSSNCPAGTPDILPTICGLLGVAAPAGAEGIDLSPLLRGEAMREPDSSLLLCVAASTTWGQRWTDLAEGRRGFPPGYFRPYRGVRTRQHTYVRDLNGPWFLYDNLQDPYQLTNLIETGGDSAVPPELERELDDWLERTDDFFGANADYEPLVDLTTGLVINRDGLTRSGARA